MDKSLQMPRKMCLVNQGHNVTKKVTKKISKEAELLLPIKMSDLILIRLRVCFLKLDKDLKVMMILPE